MKFAAKKWGFKFCTKMLVASKIFVYSKTTFAKAAILDVRIFKWLGLKPNDYEPSEY